MIFCPYCGDAAKFTNSVEVYGRDYGMVYACLPCKAWVGAHPKTDEPYGRLANAELREWKKKAQGAFDPLWKKKMKKGFQELAARESGYIWLAKQLGIIRDHCDFGQFDVEQCKRVVKICEPYLKQETTDSARYAFAKNRRYI